MPHEHRGDRMKNEDIDSWWLEEEGWVEGKKMQNQTANETNCRNKGKKLVLLQGSSWVWLQAIANQLETPSDQLMQ